jgi:hypothetical protein
MSYAKVIGFVMAQGHQNIIELRNGQKSGGGTGGVVENDVMRARQGRRIYIYMYV